MKQDKLHNIKSNGFKTPDNYFESFEDKFFEELKESTSIQGVETTGFTVPKDYFDTVETKVFETLNTKEVPVISLKPRKSFYYVAGIAASIILLLAIFLNKPYEEELSVEMVEMYLENRDLSSYELAQLLSDTDLLEEDFTITKTPYIEDNLESYLLENSDIETILE